MSVGLDRINTNPEMDIDSLFREATRGDERTVRIIIYDDPENGGRPRDVFNNSTKILWSQGLAHENGKIIKINRPPYTVTYKLTVSAWFRLIAQQNTFKDLYWSDQFTADGEWFFRDMVVWNKFWERYKDVVKLNSLDKLLLRQKNEVL
jgi:hypothetical protein